MFPKFLKFTVSLSHIPALIEVKFDVAEPTDSQLFTSISATCQHLTGKKNKKMNICFQ